MSSRYVYKNPYLVTYESSIGDMVACSECKSWYHVHCVSVPKEALEDKKVIWQCEECQEKI